jgi:hypothetical protein
MGASYPAGSIAMPINLLMPKYQHSKSRAFYDVERQVESSLTTFRNGDNFVNSLILDRCEVLYKECASGHRASASNIVQQCGTRVHTG